MPLPSCAKTLSALVVCLFLIPPFECSGQGYSDRAQSNVPSDALLRHFKKAFPAVDVSRIQTRQVFEDQTDYRETLGSSVDEGTPRATSTIVQAEVSSEMGMEYNTVTLDVILCDEPRAL